MLIETIEFVKLPSVKAVNGEWVDCDDTDMVVEINGLRVLRCYSYWPNGIWYVVPIKSNFLKLFTSDKCCLIMSDLAPLRDALTCQKKLENEIRNVFFSHIDGAVREIVL